MNMLNAKLIAPGVVSLRLSPRHRADRRGASTPRLLRYFVRGPFTLASFNGRRAGNRCRQARQPYCSLQPRPAIGRGAAVRAILCLRLWTIPGGGNAAVSINESPRTGSNNELVRPISRWAATGSGSNDSQAHEQSLEGNHYTGFGQPGQFHAWQASDLTRERQREGGVRLRPAQRRRPAREHHC